jgi:hypothetical protein
VRRIPALALGGALAALAGLARGETSAPERFAASAEVRGCALDLRHPTPTEVSLRLRAGCPLALAELLQGVDRLLAVAGAELPVPAGLALGRIAEYPWLAERLARAALADPAWDARRGRPRDGHENHYVADLLTRRRLLAELAERFAAEGVALRVAGVEKVLVGDVAEVPELRGLAAGGVDPGARLPFDAQLWLDLEPLAIGP